MTTLTKQRSASAERPLTLGDLRDIFRRRRSVVLTCLAACVLLAAAICIFSTRRYEASGEIQVQKESADGLGLDNMMGGGEGDSDALEANITLQTQADLLQSDTLALRVIDTLQLERTPDFQPGFDPLGWMIGLLSPEGVSDPPGVTLEESPRRRSHALKVFSKRLTVKVVSGARLI